MTSSREQNRIRARHQQRRRRRSPIATLRSVLPTKQDLFDDLILNKARLRDLLNGRSLNGNSLAVNADFPQQAIFLTQQLKCSKKYITSILDAVVAIDPSVGVVNSIEAIVAELNLRLEAFVRRELAPAAKSASSDASLASHVFKEIDSLGTAVAQAQTARQNTQSNTIPPTGPGPAMVYYQITRLGYFSPNEVQKSIDWLAANPNDTMKFYILPATLAAFHPEDPHTFPGKARKNLATDLKGTIAYTQRQLAPTTNWKEHSLKATFCSNGHFS
ncbi:hypothetical protein L210DRAFT_3768639 [Boletus edulis BED1]|uniref:Uncharacterized protein n=1 Tax=Boletus edulis BED1 TaxID=1328754 RepID=A0AAD4G4W3_BOLED|nr:hypothetical protein L210DRAFT_3768639 [Boletus edulis BED1]